MKAWLDRHRFSCRRHRLLAHNSCAAGAAVNARRGSKYCLRAAPAQFDDNADVAAAPELLEPFPVPAAAMAFVELAAGVGSCSCCCLEYFH